MENQPTYQFSNVSHSTKNFLIVLLLLLLIGTGAMLIFKPKGITDDQFKALNDSLQIKTDREGHHISTISALQFSSAKQFTELASKDATIKWLQSVVEKFPGQISSAVIASTRSSSSGSIKDTIVLDSRDQVRRGDTIFVFPQYKASWSSKWEKGKIIATKDSIFRNITISNDFEFTTGLDNKGFLKKIGLKKSEFIINMKNLNPNTTTQELKSFNVKNEQKRLGVGLSAGVTLNSNLRPSPYIGIGLNYNILLLK